MGLIKNYPELALSDSRKIVLNVIEAGLGAVQIENVLSKNFSLEANILKISSNEYNLNDYERITLIAFGKGSSTISRIIETILKDKLTKGFCIDVSEERFGNIDFTLGTHPLPSPQNFEFTKKVIEHTKNLNDKDLVLVVICGGGSVMFEMPSAIDPEKLIALNDGLLDSGANIIDVNTVRKHLSLVKGGGLAKILNPAKVVSLIFSDVPGNNLSFIASGPTVKDETTVEDARKIFTDLNLGHLGVSPEDFIETPKDDSVFSNTDNILMLSNLTALNAMKNEAYKWGINAEIFSDKFEGDAHEAGGILIEKTKANSILLVGGETTVKVNNPDGKGGRNQALVLSALKSVGAGVIIASVDSDGWDNSPAAGAIGDSETLDKAKGVRIEPQEYIESDNSFVFFNNTDDAIITDRLPTNVADLIVVYNKND